MYTPRRTSARRRRRPPDRVDRLQPTRSRKTRRPPRRGGRSQQQRGPWASRGASSTGLRVTAGLLRDRAWRASCWFKAVRCESLRFSRRLRSGERGNSLWATRVRWVNEKGHRHSLAVFSANSLGSALFSPLNRQYPRSMARVRGVICPTLSTQDSNS